MNRRGKKLRLDNASPYEILINKFSIIATLFDTPVSSVIPYKRKVDSVFGNASRPKSLKLIPSCIYDVCVTMRLDKVELK